VRRAVALCAALSGVGALAGSVGLVSAAAEAATRVDPTALPLGDGNVSTSPKVGYVDSCQTRFGNVGGAQAVGPWINTAAKTWNSTTKIAVQGAVSWSNASFSATVSGGRRVVKTNDHPRGHTTRTFPIGASDPAVSYDRNPNHIAAQSITWSLPANPTAASSPSCTNGGPVGVLTDGVLLFNALDGEGRDAVAHEVLDSCGGHPEMTSAYHHHEVPSCILDQATGRSTLVGYAKDGYGVYVERDSNGDVVTNASLDACHGRTSTVTWNGKKKKLYHYDATLEYPYAIGCYHGTPISTQ
jgi:hypothetical protein